MDPALVIRRELPGDEQPTRALHEAAFGVPEGADRCAEVEILDRLRADGDVLDSLTFVAELHGRSSGASWCSRARMGEGSAVALGPIGVLPERQGEGIGSALVAAVIVTADQRHEPSVVLLGDPAGTPTSGSSRRRRRGIRSPGPWPDDHFLVKRLNAWRADLAGPFSYPPAFGASAG